MNDVVVCDFDVLGIISPEDHRSVGRECLFHLESPIHLELAIVLYVLSCHESLDGRSEIPTSPKDLITTQMNIRRVTEEIIKFLINILSKLENYWFRNVKLCIISLTSWASYGDALFLPFVVNTP